ncbi:YebO family protein [Serratia sp. AKBS12]|uniref:YebO family protein n=1 Tax=Serratia sp. AKBS12 TaxID=2974597 RepID=UPI002166BE2D|nr:YebO family protein [Serratia sp. AKBS12]MCS3408259.1 YebO family protein [Serratia sp. AKBS12]HEI8864590.1 YebO family protein [Serratia odorifera]HEI8869112.1 YebO family protein [Serratia odorifera]
MFDSVFGSSGSLVLVAVPIALVVGLWVWFLINRASVRANEQVRLLQEIADQQRQQTALLQRLAGNARGDQTPLGDDDELNPALDFKGFIPER